MDVKYYIIIYELGKIVFIFPFPKKDGGYSYQTPKPGITQVAHSKASLALFLFSLLPSFFLLRIPSSPHSSKNVQLTIARDDAKSCI
jgi:hypothetical protein